MCKKIILTLTVLMTTLAVNASAANLSKEKEKAKATVAVTEGQWEFYDSMDEPTSEELSVMSRFQFGEEAGVLNEVFNDAYVRQESVVPGDPTRRTVIRKPAIYNAVRSMQKEYSKQLKEDVDAKDDISAEYVNVLRVAIAAVDSNSATFEDALQSNKKNHANLVAIFKSVTLLEF